MKKALLIFFLISLATHLCADTCYIAIENSGNYSIEEISALSVPLISQYVFPVEYIPIEGISTKACQVRIFVLENRENISVTIKGNSLNAYGDSVFRGMKGVKQAILRAIINSNPEKKDSICKSYNTILDSNCISIKKDNYDQKTQISKTNPKPTFVDRSDDIEIGNQRGKNALDDWDKFYKGDNRMTGYCQTQLTALKKRCLKDEEWKSHGSCKEYVIHRMKNYGKNDKRAFAVCGIISSSSIKTSMDNLSEDRALDDWDEFFRGDNRMTGYCQTQLTSLKKKCLKDKTWVSFITCKKYAIHLLPYYGEKKKKAFKECGLIK